MNTPSKHHRFFLIIIIGFILSVVFFLPEIVRYPGFITTHLNVDPYLITLFVYGLLITLRLTTHTPIPPRFSRFYLFILIPILLTVSILMQLVETFWFENATYAYLRLQPATFADLSLLLTLLIPLFYQPSAIHSHWKQALAALGITVFCLFVFLKWRLPEVFHHLDKEDSITEYATFFFFIGAFLSSSLSLRLLKKLPLPGLPLGFWRIFLSISAPCLLIIALEEISWGQRILQIDTPEHIRQINKQEETNLHNTEVVFNHVYDAYLLLGLYGSLSWLFIYAPWKIRGFTLKDIFWPVLSKWYLAPYFVPIVGYVVWRYATMDGTYDPWEETAELILSFGVFFIYYHTYHRLRHSLSSKSNPLTLD